MFSATVNMNRKCALILIIVKQNYLMSYATVNMNQEAFRKVFSVDKMSAKHKELAQNPTPKATDSAKSRFRVYPR